MNNFTEGFGPKLLEKIKEEKIAPKPRWKFLFRRYVVWGSGALALLLGGLSGAVIIYFLSDNDYGAFQKIDGSLFKLIFFSLPYFWLIFLAIFLFVFYYNFRHAGKGYRYSVIAVAAVSIVVSLFLGEVFFQLGAARLIDDLLGEKTSLYPQVFNQRLYFWSAPDEGRLAGLVSSQISESEFFLLDINQQEWDVVAQPEQFFLPGLITIGRPIRVSGVKTGANVFQARDIFPVGPGRRFFYRLQSDPRFHQCGNSGERNSVPTSSGFCR